LGETIIVLDLKVLCRWSWDWEHGAIDASIALKEWKWWRLVWWEQKRESELGYRPVKCWSYPLPPLTWCVLHSGIRLKMK